jgi:hypothetical protein
MTSARRIRLTYASWLTLAAIVGVGAAIAGLSSSSSAHAAVSSSAFLRMPSRFMTANLNLSSRGLGELCYGRDLMPDGTICNPAFSDEVKDGFLMGRIYVGNGYTAMSAANQLVFQPVSQEFLRDLFKRNNVVSLEGEASLVFATQYFQASFSPYRVQYFSEIHNPNLPVIGIQAAVERALELQGGVPLGFVAKSLNDVSVGTKLRILDRNYVSGRFSLAEVLAEKEPRRILPTRHQFAAYLDPSIGWRPTFGKWKLWTSVGVVNLGNATNPDPLYESPVDVATGTGVEAPVGYGRLRLGLDLVNLIHHGESAASMFRLGGSYKLGIIEGMAGWNENAVTGGLLFGFQIVQAGIVYEFMRSELDGGISENKISTEISVRL